VSLCDPPLSHSNLTFPSKIHVQVH
jgi:hypothetical protein